MKRIYKFTLEITDNQSVSLPKGAIPLTVQIQYNAPQLWALIEDHEEQVEPWCISTYGTGHPVADDPGHYLGTYQLTVGWPQQVFHVFTKKED